MPWYLFSMALGMPQLLVFQLVSGCRTLVAGRLITETLCVAANVACKRPALAWLMPRDFHDISGPGLSPLCYNVKSAAAPTPFFNESPVSWNHQCITHAHIL